MAPAGAIHALRVPDEVARLIRGLHPAIKRKVRAALQEIVYKPRCGKPLKEELAGLRSFQLGRPRIVYRLADNRVIDRDRFPGSAPDRLRRHLPHGAPLRRLNGLGLDPGGDARGTRTLRIKQSIIATWCCRSRYFARFSQSNPRRILRIPPPLLPPLLSPDYAKTPWGHVTAATGQYQSPSRVPPRAGQRALQTLAVTLRFGCYDPEAILAPPPPPARQLL